MRARAQNRARLGCQTGDCRRCCTRETARRPDMDSCWTFSFFFKKHVSTFFSLLSRCTRRCWLESKCVQTIVGWHERFLQKKAVAKRRGVNRSLIERSLPMSTQTRRHRPFFFPLSLSAPGIAPLCSHRSLSLSLSRRALAWLGFGRKVAEDSFEKNAREKKKGKERGSTEWRASVLAARI